MSRLPLPNLLSCLGACAAAQHWAHDYDTDYERAWAECPDASWLIWLCDRACFERRELVLVACQIAEDAVRRHWTGGPEPTACIETTRAWCRGEATSDQVWDARCESSRASGCVAHAAAYAAYAATDAGAAYVDAVACSVAYAAAAAYAATDARSQARREALARYADMVRAAIPLANVLRGLEVQP